MFGPNVGRVVGDENGDVADDADAAAVGVVLENSPLFEKDELDIFVIADCFGQFGPPLMQGVLGTAADRLRPFVPGVFLEMTAQGLKNGVVVEPVRLFGAEGVEGIPALCRSVSRKSPGGLAQQSLLEPLHEAEMRLALGHDDAGDIGQFQIAGLHQPFQADHQRIAGKGGKGAVG